MNDLERIKPIFAEALDKDAGEREAFLAETCGDDPELSEKVRALLRAHEGAGDFLSAPVLYPEESIESPPLTEGPGTVIGRYKLLEKIGEGGMAAVYMAEQERPIRRKVGLKIIKLGMDTRQVVARFEAERQALAMMDHPNIASILDAGATETGRPYFVMELVKGVSITDYCNASRLSTRQRLELFVQVCRAVQYAHQKGIIHRDIKPSNVMVTLHDGAAVPKVIDFGIAKATNQRLTEKTLFTRYAQMIGTPAYMSPEQAEMSGLDVDTRTDIYSLGVLLYELLTGTTPFDGEKLRSAGYLEMQRIIREEEPTKPSTKLSTLGDALTSVAERRRTSAELLRKMVKGDLDWIVMKALEKDRRRRYETAHSLAEDVERHLASQPVLACSPGAAYRLGKFYRRNRVKLAVAAVISALVVVVLASVAGYLHNRKARWARRKALPMVAKLLERGDYLAAFFVAEEAEKYIPEDPILVELWPEISRPYSIWSDPEGADVYYKEYADIEGEWLYLGRTPLESIRFPRGVYRWKLVKEGFETRECGIGGIRDIITVKLQLKNNYPEMVCVTDRRFDEYLMDKYEVTNERYKKFVDAGGYYKSEYWKHPFLKDGEQISWEEAMGEFRDKTSRPGPSNWEGGTYPQNRAKFPVSGISWYEAAAYAEFAGKSLPAVAHWFAAARVYSEATVVVPYSNFGQRPAPVGIHRGVGLQGLHDMAGNVREWCFNATDDSGTQRYILGGAYADPDYMFGLRDITTPWDRSDKNGFRCAKYLATKDSLASSLLEPIERKLRRDISKPKPYSDEEFRSDKRLYSYDRTDLAARKELTDSSPEHWRIERVTFDAAYGNERVIAYLFLPKNSRPPYQPIVYFPGADTGGLPSSEIPGDVMVFDHILMSGRAVIYPVYKGTYDRRHEKSLPALPAVPVAHRNRTVQIYQDLARTIDYLEIRGDMNVEKLTYFGFSRGVVKGPLLVALEDRIRAAILEAGGCNAWDEPIPSADPLRFATRVKVPILMLNGLNDAIFPQDNQKVLFESLGTPDEHKDHLTYATGHVISGESREKMRRDILEWLDKYLGPPDKIDGKPRSGGGE